MSISKSAVVGAIGWIGMAAVMLFAIMRWVGPHGLIPPRLLVFAAVAFSINGLLGIPFVRFAFLCRSSLGFGALFGLVIGTRYVLDAFWPTSNYIARSIDTSVAVIWIAFLAGVWGAWKSAHVRTGALVAMTASITGWIVSLGVFAFIALRQSTFILTSLTSDDEILAVSLILVAVAAVMGTTGAMFGRGLRGFVPQRLQTDHPR